MSNNEYIINFYYLMRIYYRMSKVTDNVELDFPARIADARQFTDYRSNCEMNNEITKHRGSWLDKMLLMHNADKIHQDWLNHEIKATACTKCSDNTVLPVKTEVNCYTGSCRYNVVDKDGLGQGRA